MMRRIAIGLAILMLVTACSTSDAGDETTTTTPPASDPVPTLDVADSSLGEIVVDADGATLYVFVPDAGGASTCYDQCEENWPPLVGAVGAGEGIDASLIGTTERTDGSAQVTYAGWPLYYFAGDAAAGETNGQGLNEVWWVVAPDGSAIGTDLP
jgi:predicted lipoprotein with Yx(FWY)xxD motif